MILKLPFILSSYLILSMSCVESYVFFAANIGDFRDIAKKIIPSQLADQLANMAAKQDNMNYRHDLNGPASEDYDESSKDENSDDSEDTNYSDAFYKTANPLSKDKQKSSKKKYLLHNENIDLDELVKRVKEKLETDYNVTTDVLNEANNKPRPEVTTEEEGKLEDYFYKDDTLNGDFNKDIEYEEVKNTPRKAEFTTEPNKYQVAAQYDGENIEYIGEDASEAPDYENIENPEYIVENQNENMDLETITVKQHLDHAATLKEIVRDGNDGQEVKKFDEYGNIIPKKESNPIKNINKNIPEYYEDNSEKPKVLNTINKSKKIDEQIYSQPNVKEMPEYYEDNAKDIPIEPEVVTGDIFKEIDMLKSSNDSYEDYVIPKRDNIFDSGETAKQNSIKPILGVQKFVSKNTELKMEQTRPKAFVEPIKVADKKSIDDEVIKPPVRKVSVVTPQAELIRGKTASMWYKDPNIENYDDSTKKIKENPNKKATTKRLRTMFPTRAHVKISSPNYFAKLPAVAEKYNFNEPIPEKDREPELIKHIGNPPAMINKKVKI